MPPLMEEEDLTAFGLREYEEEFSKAYTIPSLWQQQQLMVD